MRTVRNLAFVLFVLVGVFAVEKVQAFDEFCPDGCACGIKPGNFNTWQIDCWQVYDCQETYPNFCDDFFAFCYYEHCNGLVWGYECEDINGCYGECLCGGMAD